MSDLQVRLDQTNGDGKQHVTYQRGELVFPDSVDMVSAFQREESIKRAARYFGADAENVTDLSRQLATLAAQSQQQASGDKKEPRFNCYSMAELAAMNLSVDYLFRGALVANTPGAIGAREKSFKTTSAIDLGISGATFTPWLNHFEPVRSFRSVYFLGEGGLMFARDCARRVAESKGRKLADVEGFYLCDEVPSLDNDMAVKDATQALVDHEAEVAIFDPFYLMLATEGGNASSVFSMGAILRRMLEACRAAGAWPIVVHHFRKCQPIGQAPELSDLSQAGLAEFAGQWFLTNRQRAYDEEQPGEHDLIVKLGSRMGFSSKWAMHISEGTPDSEGGRYWQPTVTSYSEAIERGKEEKSADRERREKEQAERETENARKMVIAAMVKLKHPTGRAEIQARTPIQRARFIRAWASLVDDGTILEVGSERKANGHNSPIYRVES